MVFFYVVRKLRFYLVLLMLIPVVGTTGYYLIGQGQWALFDCLYMTVISITTVGYGEVLDLEHHYLGRVFTMGLLLTSNMILGVILAKVGSVLIEGELHHVREAFQMDRKIADMKNHFIIIGTNAIARQIALELKLTERDFVFVDSNEDRLEKLKDTFPSPLYRIDPIISEEVLNLAGIQHAKGIVLALPDERENVYLTLTARSLNPALRIVVMCESEDCVRKLRQVGADAIVRPDMIGGLRMASELLRPSVVTFLDRMLRDSRVGIRFEEVRVLESSKYINQTLEKIKIWEHTHLVVVAVADKNRNIVYNPDPHYAIEAGSDLIVIGSSEEVQKLQHYING